MHEEKGCRRQRASKAWSAKLTRSLTLKDGTRLVTLADARAILIRYFESVTSSRSVSRAIELLLVAAASGEFADRKAATDQLAIVLSSLCQRS